MSAHDGAVQDAQTQLSELLRVYARRSLWFHRYPLVTVRIIRLLLRLPVLPYAAAGDSPEQTLVTGSLPRRGLPRLTVVQEARHVLTLPDAGTPYNAGPARATQRRKARAAVKLGVTSRLITDEAERHHLLEVANAFEREHPQEGYRTRQPDNHDLLDVDLWMAAFEGDEPILLVVIPVNGEFAALRYFRTLTHTDASSAARYLMTETVAEELVRRDVRYLCDHVNPLRLPRGLFHFAQMVGYRVVRVRPQGSRVVAPGRGVEELEDHH